MLRSNLVLARVQRLSGGVGILVLTLASVALGATPERRPSGEQAVALAWTKDNAVKFDSIETGGIAPILPVLDEIVGDARVVGLGEGTHGAHEFLALRNEVFKYLVEKRGFTAIATETPFLEGTCIDDAISGLGALSANHWRDVESWTDPAVAENRELLEWMRNYNARGGARRPIHFYGLDMTGARSGAAWPRANPRRGVDAALEYVSRVEAPLGEAFKARMEAGLAAFIGPNYEPSVKPQADKDALTAALADLLALFDRRRTKWIHVGGAESYARARQHVVNAQFLDGDFRTGTGWGSKAGIRGESGARDASMATNLKWALDQEGPQGRILAFAHDGHVGKGPQFREPTPDLVSPSMGSHFLLMVQATGAAPYVSIGTFEYQGAIGWLNGTPNGQPMRQEYGPAEQDSLVGTLYSLGARGLAINLRTLSPAAKTWWLSDQRVRNGLLPYYFYIKPAVNFDGIIFFREVTPMRPDP